MVSSQRFEQHAPRNITSRIPSIVNLVSENDDEMLSSKIEGTKDGIDWIEQYFDFDIETDSDSDSESDSVTTDTGDIDDEDSSCCGIECSIDRSCQLRNGRRVKRTRSLLLECNRIMLNHCRYDGDDGNASITSLDSLEDARRRGISEWYKERHPGAPPHSFVRKHISFQQRRLTQYENDTIQHSQRQEGISAEESDYCVRLK